MYGEKLPPLHGTTPAKVDLSWIKKCLFFEEYKALKLVLILHLREHKNQTNTEM